MSRYNKLWVALAGAVAQAVAQGLIDGDLASWVTIIVAAVTAAGVFQVPNRPPEGEPRQMGMSEQDPRA